MDLAEPLELRDLADLELLSRVLLEARFFSGADGNEVPLSPLVAAIHQRCVDAILRHHAERGDEVSIARWTQFLRWVDRPREQASLVASLAAMPAPWARWSAKERATVVRDLTAPFTATDEEVASIVDQVTALVSGDPGR